MSHLIVPLEGHSLWALASITPGLARSFLFYFILLHYTLLHYILWLQTIAGLEKDILGHKKELLERDETIRDKEKRIYDLKKKNQELEKFKFVLDYKIRELKRQAEPKDEQISDMRDTIKVPASS